MGAEGLKNKKKQGNGINCSLLDYSKLTKKC